MHSWCIAVQRFPGGTAIKNLPAYVGDVRDRFDSWVGRIPWRRKWQPALVFLPGEPRGQRSLAGYSLCGLRESDTTECWARTAEGNTTVYSNYTPEQLFKCKRHTGGQREKEAGRGWAQSTAGARRGWGVRTVGAEAVQAAEGLGANVDKAVQKGHVHFLRAGAGV